MKSLYIIVLVTCFSCNSSLKNPETIVDIKEEKLKFIQSKIDSAVHIYNLAIVDLEKGVKSEIVKSKYEYKAVRLSQEAGRAFNEITELYERKELTQKEYDNFMNKINLKGIQEKDQELDALGVKFNLSDR